MTLAKRLVNHMGGDKSGRSGKDTGKFRHMSLEERKKRLAEVKSCRICHARGTGGVIGREMPDVPKERAVKLRHRDRFWP